MKASRGFTLIELLVVIAIIAVLAVVVIISLNPAELLRQSRDSSRLSDLSTLNEAVGLFAEDVTGGSLGTASTTYISIPDPSATSTAGDQCQGLNLPALSSGMVYHCGASSTYKNTDGTGWIPLNFKLFSAGSPLGVLPIDPTNQTSSGFFYGYGTNGTKYEFTNILESTKQRAALSANPLASFFPGLDAMGTNLSLSGLYNSTGLVGYWGLEEGTGNSASDQSGTGNNGSWGGASAGNGGTHYVGGKVGRFAGQIDGSTNSITIPDSTTLKTTAFSVSLWIKRTGSQSSFSRLYEQGSCSATPWGSYYFQFNGSDNTSIQWSQGFTDNSNSAVVTNTGAIQDQTWYHVVGTFDSAGPTSTLYINGVSVGSNNTGNSSVKYDSVGAEIGACYNAAPALQFNGSIDDVRVYNRALSPAEVLALYNAQK